MIKRPYHSDYHGQIVRNLKGMYQSRYNKEITKLTDEDIYNIFSDNFFVENSDTATLEDIYEQETTQ